MIVEFTTHSEAVAAVLRDADPGDIVEFHEEDCEGEEEPEPPYDVIGCTCQPMVFVAGEAEA